MAKISAKKSDLKTIANRIIVSPSTAIVSDLKFKRKKDFKTFVKWIESSNKALAGIKLPSKKEIEKLGKDTGGSNWLPALLGLLGIGALAALSKDKDKDKGDSDTGSGVTAEDTGANIPKPLQGPNLTRTLDITRQLNDPNIRKNNKINRNNKKIEIKNKKTLQKNLKNAKTKSNWIKKLKSNTLRNKFWTKGKPPEVTNLGERMKRVQFKHSSKWMKVGQGTTFGATKAQAPLIPDSLNKGMLDKKPTFKTSFRSNIKNLFKPGNLKNLGKGFLAGWVGDEFIEKPILNQIDKAAFHIAKRQIDGQIKKHGVAKVYWHNVDLHTKFVNKKKEGFLTDWGTNEFNEKMRKSFSLNINYIKLNYKKELEEAGIEVSPSILMEGVDYSSNRIKSGEQVATIPFPIITTDMSEKFDLPTLNTDVFAKSSSSESSIPFGLNSDDNPFSDLLLTSLK